MFEEIGIVTDPNDYSLLDIHKSTNNNLIIFSEYIGKLKHYSEILFVENSEVQDIKFICNASSQELCFATHSKIIEKYLK